MEVRRENLMGQFWACATWGDAPTLGLMRTRTLRSHLVVLTLVTPLPMIVFAVVAPRCSPGASATFQRGATERTLALLTAVDAELQGSITALEVLAMSDTLITRAT